MTRFSQNILVFFLLLIFTGNEVLSQENKFKEQDNITLQLLDSLWINPTSFFNKDDPNWRALCENLHHIELSNLNQITHTIFYGTDAKILNDTKASEGVVGSLNKSANRKKNKKFSKKIRKGFRDRKKFPDNKVVLIEGDSWFEYPYFIHEITDNLIKQDELAIYSLAYGGDWVSNMISTHQYQFEYVKLKPDVFIISGGGNDILGDSRLASLVNMNPIDSGSEFLNNYRNYVILRHNSKPVPMCNGSYCPAEYHEYKDEMPELENQVDSLTVEQIVNGRRYINKRFYRWLVSLKLEYKILIESLRKIDVEHFDSLKIITQGYDYSIPSFDRKFGIRMFLSNGDWLKEPLMLKGIMDQQTQEDVVKAMMFDFNEMMIELGKEYQNIYHVDVRGFTHYLEQHDHKKKGQYWFDELHPKSKVFKQISDSYTTLIMDNFKEYHKVVNVIEHHRLGENY